MSVEWQECMTGCCFQDGGQDGARGEETKEEEEGKEEEAKEEEEAEEEEEEAEEEDGDDLDEEGGGDKEKEPASAEEIAEEAEQDEMEDPNPCDAESPLAEVMDCDLPDGIGGGSGIIDRPDPVSVLFGDSESEDDPIEEDSLPPPPEEEDVSIEDVDKEEEVTDDINDLDDVDNVTGEDDIDIDPNDDPEEEEGDWDAEEGPVEGPREPEPVDCGAHDGDFHPVSGLPCIKKEEPIPEEDVLVFEDDEIEEEDPDIDPDTGQPWATGGAVAITSRPPPVPCPENPSDAFPTQRDPDTNLLCNPPTPLDTIEEEEEEEEGLPDGPDIPPCPEFPAPGQVGPDGRLCKRGLEEDAPFIEDDGEGEPIGTTVVVSGPDRPPCPVDPIPGQRGPDGELCLKRGRDEDDGGDEPDPIRQRPNTPEPIIPSDTAGETVGVSVTWGCSDPPRLGERDPVTRDWCVKNEDTLGGDREVDILEEQPVFVDPVGEGEPIVPVPVVLINSNPIVDPSPLPPEIPPGIHPELEEDEVEFLETRATGNRFAFILDKSGSMYLGETGVWPVPNGMRRWDLLKKRVKNSLEHMSDEMEVYLIAFSNTDVEYSKGWVKASERDLIGIWLDGIVYDGDTYPQTSISATFSMMKTHGMGDAIFFLTDGGVSGGESVPILFEKKLKKRPILVHCFTIIDDKAKTAMAQIRGASNVSLGRRRWDTSPGSAVYRHVTFDTLVEVPQFIGGND